MAVDTKFAKESFKGLPTWAKGVISIGVFAGVAYAIWKITQKLGEEPLRDATEDKQIKDELAEEIKKSPLSYGASQYATFANNIQEAGFDIGTDEESIYSVFRKIKNNADYLALLKAWGKPTRTIYEWGIGRKKTLSQFLRSEMDSKEIAKINTILANNKVKYRV
jgi:negative regulator of sigma E activity